MSDNPLFWLVLFLKVHSCPSDVQSQPNFNLLHLTHSVWFPLLSLHRQASSACISSVSNFCPDMRAWSGHLFRLTCSVVLWRERNTANKHHRHVWRALIVDGPHGGCHSPREHPLPRSKPLRLLSAPWWHSSMWAVHLMHFPGPSHSVSQVCHRARILGGAWVSSEELVSGYDTPGRYESPKIPERCG